MCVCSCREDVNMLPGLHRSFLWRGHFRRQVRDCPYRNKQRKKIRHLSLNVYASDLGQAALKIICEALYHPSLEPDGQGVLAARKLGE